LHFSIVLSVCLKFSPRGFFRIQDGRQDGRNSEQKPTNDNNFHSKCSRMVMLVLRNMFSRARNVLLIFTGSIARSAKRRYLSYSEADFEVFRLAGAKCCTDGGEIWHGGLRAKFHPHRLVQRSGYRSRSTKTENFLLRFYQNVEHKRPATRGVSLA